MLAKRIIPCLDVKDGRVVKGVSFVNLRDAGDPVDNAIFYDSEGADELVFLDITASHEKRKIILDVVEETANDVFMPLTVGGGIKGIKDIRDLLNAGCDKTSINTTAVNNPEFIRQAAERFGSQCIVVAIDAKRVHDSRFDVRNPEETPKWLNASGELKERLALAQNSKFKTQNWEVYTHGGRKPKGINAVEWQNIWRSLAPERYCLQAWTETGQRMAMTLNLQGQFQRQSQFL